MNTTYTTDVLTLLCDVCRKPVTVGQGYICVDDGTARERIREAQESEGGLCGKHLRDRLLSLSDLIDDTVVPWHIYHGDCDPHHESNDYWLDLSSCNTYKGVLRSSARLLSQTWLQHTNWNEFIYHVIKMND